MDKNDSSAVSRRSRPVRGSAPASLTRPVSASLSGPVRDRADDPGAAGP
jgi:hypothetical protein